MSSPKTKPTHLEPSELGTKEYWEIYYQRDLDNTDEAENEDAEPTDPGKLESWFSDVNAPEKVLSFLTSKTFPLSPTYDDESDTSAQNKSSPSVLDLGTGNGGMLFMLRQQGNYEGYMVGVDYSPKSIDVARNLQTQYLTSASGASGHEAIIFEVSDLISDDARAQSWWPRGQDGFDIVLDKGTFDAISLSSDTMSDSQGIDQRICELYPRKAVDLVKPGGFLLVTSCNWTEEELTRWFMETEDVRGLLQVHDKIAYKRFQFAGQQGQGVASVCFQKMVKVAS